MMQPICRALCSAVWSMAPKIPIGILYQVQKPTYHQQRPELYDGTPGDRQAPLHRKQVSDMLEQFA